MLFQTSCFLLGVFAALASEVQAASVQPLYYVAGSVYGARDGVNKTFQSDYAELSSPALVQFSGVFAPNSGAYFAQADPGIVRIYAEAHGTPTVSGGAQAAAIFQDYLTITGAPLGSALRVTFSVDGYGNDTYDGIRENPRFSDLVQDTLQMEGQVCSPVPNNQISTAVSDECTLTVPVTDGSPVFLGLHLQGDAENRSDDLSILDFSHTGRVSSLVLVDAAGLELPSSFISTASGFAYPSSSDAAVPEPGSLVLTLAGCLGMGVFIGVRRFRLLAFPVLFVRSAQGSAARRQTVEELAISLGGALDTEPAARVFLKREQPYRTTVLLCSLSLVLSAATYAEDASAWWSASTHDDCSKLGSAYRTRLEAITDQRLKTPGVTPPAMVPTGPNCLKWTHGMTGWCTSFENKKELDESWYTVALEQDQVVGQCHEYISWRDSKEEYLRSLIDSHAPEMSASELDYQRLVSLTGPYTKGAKNFIDNRYPGVVSKVVGLSMDRLESQVRDTLRQLDEVSFSVAQLERQQQRVAVVRHEATFVQTSTEAPKRPKHKGWGAALGNVMGALTDPATIDAVNTATESMTTAAAQARAQAQANAEARAAAKQKSPAQKPTTKPCVVGPSTGAPGTSRGINC